MVSLIGYSYDVSLNLVREDNIPRSFSSSKSMAAPSHLTSFFYPFEQTSPLCEELLSPELLSKQKLGTGLEAQELGGMLSSGSLCHPERVQESPIQILFWAFPPQVGLSYLVLRH